MMYIDLNDPDARPQAKRKSLLPDVSDPEKMTPAELETQGVAECEVIHESVDWWQMQGPVDRDDTVRPVRYTYTAVDRPIDDVRDIAKRRIDGIRDEKQLEPFYWNGALFQTRQLDRENMQGEALSAFMFISNGGDPQSYYWDADDHEQMQGWISIGNNPIPMTAQQMIDFALAVKARHKSLIFKARQRKDSVTQAQSVAQVVDAAGWE